MQQWEAFRAQAASDFGVFLMLGEQPDVPGCHRLHYLQMATEKLAKAVLAVTPSGPVGLTHASLGQLPGAMKRHRGIGRRLGYPDAEAWRSFLEKRASPVFGLIEAANPAVARTNAGKVGEDPNAAPNCEYPWLRGTGDWQAPCEHPFDLLSKLEKDSNALAVLKFIRLLLDRFETVFSV